MHNDTTSGFAELFDRGFKTLGGPVRADSVGLRLDAYLAKNFPFFSRSTWCQRIANGELLLNGRKVASSCRIRIDDRCFMYHPTQHEPEVKGDIALIYCDRGVASVYKPPGMPMHEGGAFRFKTFAKRVQQSLGVEWSAVHRLDKETSGLVLCANTETLRRALADQLREGEMRKEYRAIVHGRPSQREWYVDAPIGDLEESQIRIKNWVVETGGQSAMTEFMLLEAGDQRSLIAAFPRTGRTNQIRIHSAYAGFPLVGDKLYHFDESVFIDYYENGPSDRVHQATGHWRCCLHAYALSFWHPSFNDSIRVSVEPPDDFVQALSVST